VAAALAMCAITIWVVTYRVRSCYWKRRQSYVQPIKAKMFVVLEMGYDFPLQLEPYDGPVAQYSRYELEQMESEAERQRRIEEGIRLLQQQSGCYSPKERKVKHA
jgi:hypothetical protein